MTRRLSTAYITWVRVAHNASNNLLCYSGLGIAFESDKHQGSIGQSQQIEPCSAALVLQLRPRSNAAGSIGSVHIACPCAIHVICMLPCSRAAFELENASAAYNYMLKQGGLRSCLTAPCGACDGLLCNLLTYVSSYSCAGLYTSWCLGRREGREM